MTTRTFVRFDLTLESEGGVTTPGSVGRDKSDAVVDKNLAGEHRIPGTSLAGLLRDRYETVFSHEKAEHVFGVVPQGRDQTDSQEEREPAVASRLWVYDAVATPSKDMIIERSTTAIDRQRGAAKVRALRTVEACARGTKFRAYLMWEDAPETYLDDLRRCLVGWKVRLGRGVSTGAGVATISDAYAATIDLTTDEGLRLWLEHSGHALVDLAVEHPSQALDLNVTESQDQRIIEVRFVVDGPVLVGGGHDGNQLRARRSGGKPVLPGSSIKGVMRSRMEYILRSVKVQECSLDAQRCGRCLPCDYFGHGGKADKDATSVGARGRVIPDTAEFIGVVGEDQAYLRARTHVAIDRFTGGSARVTPIDDIVHSDTEDGGRGKLGGFKGWG